MKLGIKLRFSGIKGSIKIASAAFAVIIFIVALDSLGLIGPIWFIRSIKTILLLSGGFILVGETYFEDRRNFNWDFPTVLATITIIGVFMLAWATLLALPPGIFLVDTLFTNEFVIYLGLAAFLMIELFKIDVKRRRR